MENNFLLYFFAFAFLIAWSGLSCLSACENNEFRQMCERKAITGFMKSKK